MLSGVSYWQTWKIVTNWVVRSTFEVSITPKVTGSLPCKLPLEWELPSTLKFRTESQLQVRWEVQTSVGSVSRLPKQEQERCPQRRGTWNCIVSKEGTSGSYKQAMKTLFGLEMQSVLGWHGVLFENFIHAHKFMSNKKRAGLWTQRIPQWHSQQGAQVPLSQHFLYDLGMSLCTVRKYIHLERTDAHIME